MEKHLLQTRSFKAYMRLDYVNNRFYLDVVECILIAIDFENDVLKLRPILDQGDENFTVEEKDFWCSIDYVEFPKKKMVVVK